MAGVAAAYIIIVRGFPSSAGIARNGAADSLHMLKDALYPPEATARENRSCGFRGDWRVNDGGREADEVGRRDRLTVDLAQQPYGQGGGSKSG